MIRPRLRARPGAVVAAHVGDLPHAVARHVREPAAERLGDALRQRRLAYAGRSDEAEDQSPRVTLPAAHGQVLENAILRFPESEVPCVEGPSGAFEIKRVRLAADPRQFGQTPEVLHRLRVGLVQEAVELRPQLRPHRLGHAARVELAAESGERVVQLLLGILESLLQKIVAVRSQAFVPVVVPAVRQHARVALDPGPQGALVHAVRRHHGVERIDHEGIQRPHACARIEHLQPLLLEVDWNIQIRNPPDQADRDEVGGHIKKP